jgi:hypothetical protein
MRRFVTAFFLLSLTAPALGQSDKPSLYITPTGDGFESYIAAAMVKKEVPVTVLDHQRGARYVLKTTQVDIKRVSGKAKLMNCVFASCEGNEDEGSTSVQLVENGTIRWSYSVNKDGGARVRQSMAEAIAKHLKKEFFRG